MRDLIVQQWTAVRSKRTPPAVSYDVLGELGEIVCVSIHSAAVLHIVQMHNEALRLAEEGPEVVSRGGAE